MKFKIVSLLLTIIISTTGIVAQELNKPENGKALVYFMRSNNLGGAMNFRVYDKDRFLGALPSKAYFTYECDPGDHLFWAASENRDYVEATLEANKTYVIDMRAKMGVFIAAVGLEPYSPKNEKHVKRVKKVIRKHVNANVVNEDRSTEKEENIEKALEAYEKLKGRNNSKIKKLSANMNFEN